MVKNRLPQVVQPVAGVGGAGEHRDTTVLVGLDEFHGDGQFTCRDAGVAGIVTVCLVDRDDVCQLKDALLDALQLVTGTSHGKHEEGVDHLGDGDLRLSDTDRLDEYDVVPGGLHDDHGLSGGPGHTAQVPARG